MLRHVLNLFLWLLPPSRMFAVRRACLRIAHVKVGENTSVCGRGWIYGRGRFQIGRDTWLSPAVIVYTHLDADIEIGDNCDIGPAVEFVTGGHSVGPSARRAGQGRAERIVIKNGCWIGAGSRILGGVTIGSGVVVAAGSVVTRDVPDNVLVAGVPAIVKKQLG
jgi:maltose O-acetyltransferase